MSLTAQRYNTRSSLLGSQKNQEAVKEINEVHDELPYTREYFAAFAAQPFWNSRRSSMVELPFLDAEEALRKSVEAYIGDGNDSPNWQHPEEITIGYAFGANQNNFLIWQGSQYWDINAVLSQDSAWPSAAPWYVR